MENTKELVSILLPVLNPDPLFFRQALDSLLAQSYKEIEIVIVEDPGEHTARGIIEEYRDSRIRYIRNAERTSLREQLNLAIKESRGEFLARMDADDISVSERITTQLAYLKANPSISLVGSNLEAIDDQGRSLGYRRLPENHEEIARKLRVFCTIAHPSVMFRKVDLLEMQGYQVSAPMEDWDLWCRMALAGKRFHNIQKPLLRYRIHLQAGKVVALRRTLLTGIALKKRHFQGVAGMWGWREQLRCFFERLLLYLPAGLVVRLFRLLTLRRIP